MGSLTIHNPAGAILARPILLALRQPIKLLKKSLFIHMVVQLRELANESGFASNRYQYGIYGYTCYSTSNTRLHVIFFILPVFVNVFVYLHG